jgi:hypothetical protein
VADQNTKMHLMTGLYPADPAMLEFVNAVPLAAGSGTVGGLPARAPAPAASPGGSKTP